MIITIDGPAGGGKSSVAKAISKKLNIYYLYTGLLYRAVASILMKNLNKKISDFDKLSFADLSFISQISYFYINDEPQIIFEDKNLTKELYSIDLEQPASIISTNKFVRELLLNLQQNLSKKYDLIADGRDCGSVVFPNADYKFFLTADLDTRAKRIFGDKKRSDTKKSFDNIKSELEIRDKRDMQREIAPLTIPDKAIIIDNSKLTEEDTVKEFLRFIKNK